MPQRLTPIVLAAAVAAVLLPATSASARCYGDAHDPRAIVCNATCRVYSELELAYC